MGCTSRNEKVLLMPKANKGAKFERWCCKRLSLWWTKNKHDDLFMRNRVRATRFSPDAKNQLGDITTATVQGIPFMETFSVECKTGYSKTRKGKVIKNKQWDLLDVIDGSEKEPTIVRFWKQCVKDAELSLKIPLLIFKRDMYAPVACVRIHDLKKFVSDVTPEPSITLYNNGEAIDFYNLEVFLHWLRPILVKVNHRKSRRRK